MKALKRMALIHTPLLVALTGRSAAGVTRVPLVPGRRMSLPAPGNGKRVSNSE